MLEIAYDKQSEAALTHIHQSLKNYPQVSEKAIGKSLQPEGYRLRMVMKDTIDKGGVATNKWPGINPQAKWFKAARKRGRVKNYRVVTRGKRKRWRGKEYWSERFLKTVDLSMSRKAQSDTPLAKFKGGLRYDYEKEKLKLEVGFVNPSFNFEQILEKHAAGFSTPISEKARRFAFAMGLPISMHKHFFHIPARPLIGPVWEQEKDESLRNIEKDFFKNINQELSRVGP